MREASWSAAVPCRFGLRTKRKPLDSQRKILAKMANFWIDVFKAPNWPRWSWSARRVEDNSPYPAVKILTKLAGSHLLLIAPLLMVSADHQLSSSSALSISKHAAGDAGVARAAFDPGAQAAYLL